MLDGNSLLTVCPNFIAVIGGGRWARVLVGVLCGIVPENVKIIIHTSHNVESMSAWISDQKFVQNVDVSSKWPEFNHEQSAAMIVVNAARDHEKSIERGLNEKLPLLVEKPITFSETATKRMVDLAKAQNVPFASAHIFLFADYLDNFTQVIPGSETIQSIRIFWVDPKSESRYGEKKKYDPGLPMHMDWLPHIISIVGKLTSGLPSLCKSLDFKNGGAHLNLELMLGDVSCNVEMIREGQFRKRFIEVETDNQSYILDFSNEPGTIVYGTSQIIGTPDWEERQRPAAKMLTSFLTWAAGGEFDERLSVDVGLRVNHIIDQVSDYYDKEMLTFLVDKLSNSVVDDVELRYALKEILSSDGPLDEKEYESQVIRIQQYFSEIDTSVLSGMMISDICPLKDVIRNVS